MSEIAPYLEKGPKDGQDTYVNKEFAHSIIFIDPETGEELRPLGPPEGTKNGLIITVVNISGKRKWRHTIKTEEL